jgi:hypothetical protein
MKTYNGASIDTRSKAQKEKDFRLEELVASTTQPVWQTKSPNAWRTFPISDQHQTDQCVAFTVSKLMGIDIYQKEGEFVDFSKSYLYEQRVNKPSGGMGAVDAFELARKGVTLEYLYPTKTTNNNNVNLSAKPHEKRVAEVFKIDAYVSLPLSIDTIASTIQATQKGVMVWFWGTFAEWNREVPVIQDTSINLHTAPVRHSVTAVDYFIYNGKKALLIEDSWGISTGIKGRRIITEDFFSRCYYAGYATSLKYEISTPTQIKITQNLQFGMRNQQVQLLQQFLKDRGYFPANHSTTTYYGAITARAVLQWQIDNKVDTPQILNQLQGRFFGTQSRAKM